MENTRSQPSIERSIVSVGHVLISDRLINKCDDTNARESSIKNFAPFGNVLLLVNNAPALQAYRVANIGHDCSF